MRRSEWSRDQPGHDCGSRRGICGRIDRQSAGAEDDSVGPRSVFLAIGRDRGQRPSAAHLCGSRPRRVSQCQWPAWPGSPHPGRGACRCARVGEQPCRSRLDGRSGRVTRRPAARIPGGRFRRECTRGSSTPARHRVHRAPCAGTVDRGPRLRPCGAADRTVPGPLRTEQPAQRQECARQGSLLGPRCSPAPSRDSA